MAIGENLITMRWSKLIIGATDWTTMGRRGELGSWSSSCKWGWGWRGWEDSRWMGGVDGNGAGGVVGGGAWGGVMEGL